ncbi:MAG: NifU family protein [Actinobacteria bacterium]|nr:MAG: NifU family protein [Actinomycetota bacterium]REK32963.1 MAG: NifU family protein [Actinomycetota bacterium]
MTTGPQENVPQQLSLEEIVTGIQSLLERIEGYSDPTVRRMVFEMLDLLDAMHGEALVRLVAGLKATGIFDEATADPFVAHLLSVYGLLEEEDDPTPLVEEAIAEVRPYVHSHGGEIELVAIEGGIVRVRMLGSCSGCPSSVVTLTQSVEKAVRSRWPSFIKIEVDDEQDDTRWQSVTIQSKP